MRRLLGIKASIQHTQLVWREWERPFEIELLNLHVQKDQDAEWLKIEHVGVSLQLHRLLRGEVALKHIRINHPHILLQRNNQGKFSLGFGESRINQEFSFEEMAPLLVLGSFNSALGKLNDVRKISIVDAQVVLKDDRTGQKWDLPKATFVLERYQHGFQADLILSPLQGRGLLSLALTHTVGAPRVDLMVRFEHIAFTSLIEKDRPLLCSSPSEEFTSDDILNFFQNWEVPLNGIIHMALVPATLQVIEGSCDVDIGKGNLDLSIANLRPFPLEAGNLSFILSPHSIELKRVSLLSDEMLFQLSGTLSSPTSPLVLTKFFGPGQTLDIQGKVEDLSLNHLAALWPQNVASAPREWLTQNLREGTLTEATVFLKGHGGEKGFTIDDLRGTLSGEGAELTYLQGLPPAQNVKATATFNQRGFDIKIASGHVEKLQLSEGHVIIKGLDTDKEALTLDIKGKGSLPGILDIINHQPLEYASYAGIDPVKTKGKGSIALHMDFPLLNDLRFKDVKLALKGAFKGVELNRKITEDLNAHLTEGSLSVNLTQDQMDVKGTGVFNQLPSSLLYMHYFTPLAPDILQVQVNTRAFFEDFKRLGFDYEAYGKGPVETKLVYTLAQDKKSHMKVDLDMTPASLVFSPLKWEKKAGEKSSLSFDLLFEEGHLSKMTDLKLSSSLYSFQGGVLFGPKGAWTTIHLTDFKGPHTHTHVTLHAPRENVYEVSFKGESVDLEKFLEYVHEEETMTDFSSTDIKLFANVNQLRLGEGKIFHNVQAAADLILTGKDTLWKMVKLRAKAGEGIANEGGIAHVSGGISFDLEPGPHTTQRLTVQANDAGQFLKNLSIYDDVREGQLMILAERQNHGPFEGVFKLDDFDAHKIPLLARFAAVLSPVGIVNLFSDNESLSMEHFECDFTFDDAFVAIRNGIGKSISFGFTVEGKLDRIKRLYNLKGNFIPARFLNSILNNIPVLGSLLHGGKGEGLFGLAYTVKGPFEKPQISTNPLSMFAPGFLRKIFSSDEEEK